MSRQGYIMGYAKIPIKKYISNYNCNVDIEEICDDDKESILYEATMENGDSITFLDLEFYESEE